MELLHVALTTIGSIVALFLLTKLIGNKQMSELNMFDYINGITIGSIAAEMATALEDDFLKPLLAMVLYALAALLITILSRKSLAMSRFFSGHPIILLENGKLYKKNLAKAKLDINEFLTQCRISGFFNLADIQTAILEGNGKLSILPRTMSRPVTVRDMNLDLPQDKPVVTVIVDGKVLEENLHFTGNDQTWLNEQLDAQGILGVENVFLATCDSSNRLSVYTQLDEEINRDPFQ